MADVPPANVSATSRKACHCWQIPSQVVLQSLPLDLLPQHHWVPFRGRFSLQTSEECDQVYLTLESLLRWISTKSSPYLRLRVLACACMFQLYGLSHIISLHCELWIRLAWPMTATKSWSGKVKTQPTQKQMSHQNLNSGVHPMNSWLLSLWRVWLVATIVPTTKGTIASKQKSTNQGFFVL